MKTVHIFVVLLCSLATLNSNDAAAENLTQLTTGEMHSFTASGDTGITYHVQVPASYESGSKPPLLIVFSPGGDGKTIVRRLAEGVREAGWLLVGCDKLRNNMHDHDHVRKLEDEVLYDILRRIAHDPKRIYLGGFSGGAWRAYHLTTRRTEPFAGILAFGGWLGGAESQEAPYRQGMSVAMVNGIDDKGAGGWMPTDTNSLRKRNCRVKHFAFEGGHKIAPPLVTKAAVKWLDEQWTARRGASDSSGQDKQDLKVLYVGQPGPRADDFTSLLAEHFQSAGSVSPDDCTLELTNEADVLLMDATVRSLPEQYAKAMVMVGSPAALTGERYGSKIDWLCQCLDNEAYHVNTTHPIFSGPIPVTPTLVAKKCPHAKLEIQAWKVHRQQKTAGLVSSRRHFEKAEDSEIIAGGVNMKGIHGVALVREAHRMLWGFIAPPSEMTPEARQVLVNALVWIHQFDGHQQTSFAGITTRDRIQSILDSPYTRAENLIRWFSRELLVQTGNDKEKIRKHFAGRLPYVFVPVGSGQLRVDEDAEAFGTSNNDPASLHKWVEMLDGDSSDVARRLLQRYTGKRFRKEREWREWVEQQEGRLRFSDERGYRFYAIEENGKQATADIEPHRAETDRVHLTAMAPVQFDLALQATHEIAGEHYQFRKGKVTLVVRARVKDGWFFYPPTADGLGNTPTTIDVTLPSGMSFVDDWQNPEPTDGKLSDGVVFKRVVNVGKPDQELCVIQGRLAFQACTPTQCLRPQTTEFSLPIRVIPR